MTFARPGALRYALMGFVATWMVAQAATAGAAETSTGEANFTRLCSACHTIGGGRRVGPDLKGIGDRRDREWLVKWIASSQTLVRSGDPIAVALLAEYNNMPMPDAALSADEIRGVLEYIGGASAGSAQGAPAAAPERAATAEEILRGEELFRGSVHFTNGGPACSACHHVTQDAVVGGGVLAMELTTSFTRLGGPGVRAILAAPPFPVMAQAFNGKPLTEDEMIAVGGYLQSVGQRPESYNQAREDTFKLLGGGLGGVSVLLGVYALVWRRRKTEPVNREVFARQVRSQ
ncbi:MAG: c-type cytochrome [Deltaproteobacteria bacterium]|nr:c-type cytochrome [Deltaproteobacteria bacterium]